MTEIGFQVFLLSCNVGKSEPILRLYIPRKNDNIINQHFNYQERTSGRNTKRIEKVALRMQVREK